jgi:hypothetical protein
MGKFLWTEYFSDWQNAVDILNDLAWNLSWKETNGQWHLWGGDQKIFVGDTEGEFQAFLCGLALGFAVLPDPVLEQVRRIASE